MLSRSLIFFFILAALGFAQEPALLMPKASKGLFTSITKTDSGTLIAVGERGHILRSEYLVTKRGSKRLKWEQVTSPVRSFLSSVTSVGDLCWAVGHDGCILHSPDDGQTWGIQHYDPLPIPEIGLPYLLFGVAFANAEHGVAVGHQGMWFKTQDGGKTWENQDGEGFAGERLSHVVPDAKGGYWCAAEFLDGFGMSALYHFSEGKWTPESLPGKEDKIMNGLVLLADGSLYAGGNAGLLFRRDSVDKKWEKINWGGQAPLHAGFLTQKGEVVLVGHFGTVLRSRKKFQKTVYPNWPKLTGGIDAGDGVFFTSDKGILQAVEGDPF